MRVQPHFAHQPLDRHRDLYLRHGLFGMQRGEQACAA